MENEDNFFLIQQIQERELVFETKRKEFNEMRQKFSKEIHELEKILGDIELNYDKVCGEMKAFENQMTLQTFNEEDFNMLKLKISETFKTISPQKEVKVYDPIYLLKELELKLNSQIGKLNTLQNDKYYSSMLQKLEKKTK